LLAGKAFAFITVAANLLKEKEEILRGEDGDDAETRRK
jgi:hypothetical protein